MKKKFCFYCWMRVVPRGVITIEAPGRPPRRTIKDKPWKFVEATWVALDGQYNRPSTSTTVLDYDQPFVDEKEATAWIDSKEADGWKKDAISYSLMTFELDVEFEAK